MLTLILGGARSGKSRLARSFVTGAGRVCFIATARAEDDPEMQARIARHRAERPESWQTIEEPLAVAEACERAARDADAVIVDCLTLWLSNLLWEHRAEPPGFVEETGRSGIARIAAASRWCRIILVSNEVGCATVPEAALARAFRDTQGLLNQSAAEAADEVIFTVAGLPLYLKPREIRK